MHRVYVRGTAICRTWQESSANLNDLIFRTTKSALADAGLAIEDVDGVVLAAHDLTDGRSLTSMVTGPAAGAYLKDEVRLSEDGASAFVVAAARVQSGAAKACIVAAWGRASEANPDAISNALFDPFLTRPLGMTELAVSAMRAGMALQRKPGYSRWRTSAADRYPVPPNESGRRSPAPAPLRPNEVPVWSDVVAALVLTAEPGPVEVLGLGMGTEPYRIGDRDLLRMPALARASQQALQSSGHSIGDVDVLEFDGLTLFDEALALEVVGAVPEGAGMQELAEGSAANRDDGFASGYCAPAMGLVRICRATERLSTAGRVGLATGSSVVAGQTQAAVVLART